MIEGISADSSGRSFMIRVPSGDPFYFWCSEKSRLVGYELLEKMRNLLEKKPSLADLTGISDSRLKCFVTHLRTYLVGANTQVSNNTAHVSITSCSGSSTTSLALSEAVTSSQSASSKSSRGRSNTSVLQGSLSPRPSSFKEAPPRNLASLKNVVKEKLRRKVEAGNGSVENSESLSANTSSSSPSNQSVKDKFPEIHLFPLVSGLEVGLTEKTVDTVPLSLNPIPSISMSMMTPSLYSPYYCWCPPGPSTLQYTVAPTQMTPMSMAMADSFTLPPLSSLLAGSSSSDLLAAAPKPSPLNLDEIPPFLPESTSQQFPTFTPLMTDSIVHIPVIDICSSGQAYLVSAGPGIPPLHHHHHHHLPLIQQTDSMAEKSARDTLRLLISGSSQLPSVLATVGGNQFQNGSRGLYGGATDVNHAIANSIAAMGMVSLSDRRRFIHQGDLVDLLGEDSGGGISTRPNDDDQSSFSDSGTGKTL